MSLPPVHMAGVVISLELSWPCPIPYQRNPALLGRSAACWPHAGLLQRKELTSSPRGIGEAGYLVCPAPQSCLLLEGGIDVPNQQPSSMPLGTLACSGSHQRGGV